MNKFEIEYSGITIKMESPTMTEVLVVMDKLFEKEDNPTQDDFDWLQAPDWADRYGYDVIGDTLYWNSIDGRYSWNVDTDGAIYKIGEDGVQNFDRLTVEHSR